MFRLPPAPGHGRLTPPSPEEATMDKLKMNIEELSVDTFEVDDEKEDALLHGAARTVDPTKCDPHSCVPTFPC
jgi:hypothetical protein